MPHGISQSKIAYLNEIYLKTGTIPGSWLDPASVTTDKLAASVLSPYTPTSGLASVATSGEYSDLSGTPSLGSAASQDSGAFATAAQGAQGSAAYAWGNHASAGYLTIATCPRPYKEVFTMTGGETAAVLARTPIGDVQVFMQLAAGSPVLWEEGAGLDYTISGDTITFAALAVGDKVHVYYQGVP